MMYPCVPGYWKIAPKTVLGSRSTGSPTTISIPSGSARVRMTARLCGWHSWSTKKARAFDLAWRWAMVIASAAAVASSSSDELAMSIAVRSVTSVWKFSIASSRPWLISGW